MSVRWKLTLSYAGFLIVAGILLLAVVWIFLLRYVPNIPISAPDGFVPNRSDLRRAFFPRRRGHPWLPPRRRPPRRLDPRRTHAHPAREDHPRRPARGRR